jgi:cytochrome b
MRLYVTGWLARSEEEFVMEQRIEVSQGHDISIKIHATVLRKQPIAEDVGTATVPRQLLKQDS